MSDYDVPHLPRRAGKDDPRIVGPWKLGRTIGEGATGRVRLARNRQTGEHAAVKIISKTLFKSRFSVNNLSEASANALRAAEREIVIMKLIEHPNILQLIDVWITPSELILILEYADGGELFDYLCKRGRLPMSEALDYFQQIMAAVDYCHRFNICHRDLKPENILLDGENRIKIADFGMAVWQGGSDLLQTSCGSPHYAAPEVVNGLAYDGKMSDIWSCGVILYALLNSRLPFDHEHLDTLLGLIRAGKYKMPTDLDLRAKGLISRMLQVDVSKRITMPQILVHPFFVAQPPKYAGPAASPKTQAHEALSSIHDIDIDMLNNLQILWPGIPAEVLVERLQGDEASSEKNVYHLLVQYRKQRIEKQQQDDEVFAAREARRSQAHEERSAPRSVKHHKSSRASPPAVVQSTDHSFVVVSSPELDDAIVDDDFVQISPSTLPRPSNIPSIFLPTLEEEYSRAALSSTRNLALSTTSPLTPVTLTSPSWGATFGFPSLNVSHPESQDFFQQVVELLHAMEEREAAATKVPSPNPGAAPYPTPLSETFGIRAVVRTPGPAPPPTPVVNVFAGLGIGDDEICAAALHGEDEEEAGLVCVGVGSESQAPSSHAQPVFSRRAREMVHIDEHVRSESLTAPLNVRRVNRRLVPSSAADKENQVTTPLETLTQASENAVMAGNQTNYDSVARARAVLGEKKIQIPGPSPTHSRKTKSKRPPQLKIPLVSPGPSDSPNTATSSPFAPTPLHFSPPPKSSRQCVPPHSKHPPRRAWFSNPFKGKAARYQLLSVHDMVITRDECRRLLTNMGVAVTLTHPDAPVALALVSPRSLMGKGTAAASPGVLKCVLEEARDPAGALAVVRGARFRVEVRPPSPTQASAGFASAMHIVQQDGALATFKLMFNRLRREWTMDYMATERCSADKNDGAVGAAKESYEDTSRYQEFGMRA